MESTSYVRVLSSRMVFFYFVTTGWIFDISLLYENSINQTINSKLMSKIQPVVTRYTVDPMLLPSGNPFKCHEEVLFLQPT